MAVKIDYEQLSKDVLSAWENKKTELVDEAKKHVDKIGKIVSKTTVPGVGTTYEAVCPYCGHKMKNVTHSSYVPSRITCPACNKNYSHGTFASIDALCAFKCNDEVVLASIYIYLDAIHHPDGTFKDFVLSVAYASALKADAFAVAKPSGIVRLEKFKHDNGDIELVKSTKKFSSLFRPGYGANEVILLDGITDVYGVSLNNNRQYTYQLCADIEKAGMPNKAKTSANTKLAQVVTFDYEELGVEKLTDFLFTANVIDELHDKVKGQAWCKCGNVWEGEYTGSQADGYSCAYKVVCPQCGAEHIVTQSEIQRQYGVTNSVIQISDNDTENSWDMVFLTYTIDTEWNVESTANYAARVNKTTGKIERFLNDARYSAAPVWKKTQKQERYGSYSLLFTPDSLKYSGLKETWENVKEYTYYSVGEFINIPTYISQWVQHPIIEQVVKRNKDLACLIWDCFSKTGSLRGENTQLNLEGKNTAEVFGISERLMKVFCKDDVRIEMYALQALAKADPDVAEESIRWISENSVSVADIVKLHNFGISITDVTAYLERVRKVQYVEPYAAIREWSDYLTACEIIGTDLNDRTVKYPRYLLSEHNIVVNKRKVISDANKDDAFATRCSKYAKLFSYKDKDIIVKVPDSVQELFEEGRKLHHCVGTYADRIISGENLIFFIRKVKEPDKPWLTVDLNEAGQILELKGDFDRVPTTADKKFLVDWVKKKNLNAGKWVS